MRTIKNLILIVLLNICTVTFSVDYPQSPTVPDIKGQSESTHIQRNVVCTRNDGLTITGECGDFNQYSLNNLIWETNKDGKKTIPINQVKSIVIKGYTKQNRTADNLSMVYYTPYLYDITLTNGQIIENVIGKIPQINVFNVQQMRLPRKCYSYFVRYWLVDKGEFLHNGSKDYNEKPVVPDETIVRIDFADK